MSLSEAEAAHSPDPGRAPGLPLERAPGGDQVPAFEPLETLLDLLLLALRARSAVLSEAVAGGRTLGRRAPGRPIARPERLLRAPLCEEILRSPGPIRLAPGAGRGWAVGFRAPLAGPAGAAVLIEGPAPFPPELGESWRILLERLAPSIQQSLRLARDTSGGLLGPVRDGAGSELAGGSFPGIIAFSASMVDPLRMVARVAPSEAAVLIEGESGTGKELIARAIHQRSPRAGGPFNSENCAACPEGLLESEFFGVERGAFTGAMRTKPGLFERSSGGTLFLDEIGEMDLGLQRKLLRVLQEREVRRVGGIQTIPVDFRLISATNRVLAEETRAGRFRQDVLYRIDVVTIRLPPLRERPEDIQLLVRHFLELHSSRAGVPVPPVDPSAQRLLQDYHWPGNVRELENEMLRAVALGAPEISGSVLSPKIREAAREREPPRAIYQPGQSLFQMERDFFEGVIREVLAATGGNKFRAAELLGIPKTTLYRRMRRYDIL